MLSWIACVDNLCKIHAALKISNTRYLKRTNWRLEKQRYRDAKFMHRWHPILNQNEGELIMELERFLIKECIKG